MHFLGTWTLPDTLGMSPLSQLWASSLTWRADHEGSSPPHQEEADPLQGRFMSSITSLVLGPSLQIVYWSHSFHLASGHLLRLVLSHSTFLAYLQGHLLHAASLGLFSVINGCLLHTSHHSAPLLSGGTPGLRAWSPSLSPSKDSTLPGEGPTGEPRPRGTEPNLLTQPLPGQRLQPLTLPPVAFPLPLPRLCLKFQVTEPGCNL